MKFKVKRRRGGYRLEGRTEKNEEFDYPQAQLVMSGECLSLLAGTYTQKSKGYVLSYFDGHSIPFSKAAKRVDNDFLLKGCLLSFLQVADEFESHDLLMRRTCFEPELVFYDSDLNRLKFAYAPIMGKSGGQADAMRLFSRLLQMLKCQSDEAVECQKKATDYFRRNVIFSAVQYRGFLESAGLLSHGDGSSSEGRSDGDEADAPQHRSGFVAQPSRGYDFAQEAHEQTGRMPQGSGPGAQRPRPPIERTSLILTSADADDGYTLIREADGRKWSLQSGRNVVGRSVNADIVLDGFRQISARHAVVELTDVQCLITDLGSTNGTYVNDQLIEPGKPYALARGDRVHFADLAFIIG